MTTNTRPKENPPAFPGGRGVDHYPGISLRDYFAAAALQGILANPDRMINTLTPREYAEDAYLCADAMLAANPPLPGGE